MVKSWGLVWLESGVKGEGEVWLESIEYSIIWLEGKGGGHG